MVTLRFFAAARSAAGTDQVTIAATEPLSIAGALQRSRSDSPDYDVTMARCSFLVNGVATTDRAHLLAGDDVVDVLPPFAGG